MASAKPWYHEQLRIVQTVLREPDVVDYDAEAVADYLERVHSNCIIINGGGIVDFFRHDLATANPNPFLGETDPLKALTDACHKRNIKVVVRVDFRGVDKKIYELRPDWFAVNEKGEPMIRDNPLHNAIFQPCYQSKYRNEHCYAFIDQLFQRYDIDGIWENSYNQHGICYCKSCSDRYRRETGKELPRGGDFFDPHYDEYRVWKAACVEEHLRDCRAVVKKYGEDKAFAAEIFGLYHDQYKSNGHDLYAIRDHFDFLVTPLFTADHEPMNGPATLIKFLKSLSPDKTPVLLFGHLGTNNNLRYVSSPKQETRLWMWEAISAGGSFWNVIFNGQHPDATYDRRNAFLCEDVFGYMKRNEDVLSEQRSVAEVTVLYSRATNAAFGKEGYLTHLMGLEQVLNDRHIQYRLLTDDRLNAQTLSETKVLVLANAACLSDDELETIRAFVQGGGKLVSTYRTSFCRPDGSARPDYALGDVFGCAFTGVVKDNSTYGYQYVRERDPVLTRGFERTEMLASWGPQMLVRRTSEAARMILSYVPQIFPQPPERSWLREYETDYPTALLHRYGEGESLFFPYGVDRNVWTHGHFDFADILANAVDYMLEGSRIVETEAPSSVHFALNRSGAGENEYVLHIVNTTSAPRRPVLETVPLHDVEAKVTLPGARAAEFRGLFDGASVELAVAERSGENVVLHLRVPRLYEYASAYIRIEREERP